LRRLPVETTQQDPSPLLILEDFEPISVAAFQYSLASISRRRGGV